jgi:hypothetical protein
MTAAARRRTGGGSAGKQREVGRRGEFTCTAFCCLLCAAVGRGAGCPSPAAWRRGPPKPAPPAPQPPRQQACSAQAARAPGACRLLGMGMLLRHHPSPGFFWLLASGFWLLALLVLCFAPSAWRLAAAWPRGHARVLPIQLAGRLALARGFDLIGFDTPTHSSHAFFPRIPTHSPRMHIPHAFPSQPLRPSFVARLVRAKGSGCGRQRQHAGKRARHASFRSNFLGSSTSV